MEYGHAVPYPQYTEGLTGQPQAVFAWQRIASRQVMTFERFVGGATQKRVDQGKPLTTDQPKQASESCRFDMFPGYGAPIVCTISV